MATGVLKVRVGGVWQAIGASGSLPAHAISHMTGGADAILLDTLAPPTDVTTLNASTSAHGLLRKLSGNAIEFLNGQGQWTAVPANLVGPAAAVTNDLAAFADNTGKVLKDSGISLAVVARLDQGPTFAGPVQATMLASNTTGWGSLSLTHADGPVGKKNFQFYYASGQLVGRGMSDDWATQLGYMVLDGPSGMLTLTGDLYCGQGNQVRLGVPDGTWPSMYFYQPYFTFNHPSGGQLFWMHQTGVFNLNLGLLRFGSTTFSLSNASAANMLTVRNDGVVTVPLYLVIPVGTDKWAPA